MRGKHVKIELNPTERGELVKFSKTRKRSVKLVNRAKISKGKAHKKYEVGVKVSVGASDSYAPHMILLRVTAQC